MSDPGALAQALAARPAHVVQGEQCVTDDPDNAVVIYPVAGLGTTPRPRTSTLVDLVGASRARILHDLDRPRSTTELSRRHQLSASTVSYHLGVLLDAGMVHRTRRGLAVEYARSARGDTLVLTQ